jgi:hypothetical protein
MNSDRVALQRACARAVLAFAAIVFAPGCDSDETPRVDAGRDSGGHEPDGGDPEPDSGPTADSGNPSDAGADEDSGPGDDDAGEEPDPSPGPWQGCPDGDDFAGAENGPHTLHATEAAVYCAMFDEARTLEDELAAKAMLRVAPGSYGLPGADAASFALPLCIRFRNEPHPELQTPGAVTYTTSELGSGTSHVYDWAQPTAIGTSTRELQVRFEIVEAGSATPSITLDGENVPPFDETLDRASFKLCDDPATCYSGLIFESCTFENAIVQLHSVSLGSDGSLDLELHIGDSFASTEPGAFVRAAGTFRGQSFDQRDYWRLVYSPEHHHFARDFAVLFDAPIGDACGIEIAQLEPGTDNLVPDEAYAIDCELDRIETLTVTDHVLDVMD